MKEIIVYSRIDCPYCREQRDFLNKNKIVFTEIVIEENPGSDIEMFKRTKQQGVPALIIGDEIIIGFNKRKLSQTLLKKRR